MLKQFAYYLHLHIIIALYTTKIITRNRVSFKL